MTLVVERAMGSNLSTKTWSAQLLARWKFLLSFRKSAWDFEDYPVIVRKQGDGGQSWGAEPHFTAPAYIARMVNWTGLDGFGNTPAEAKRDLREAFERACASRRSRPRPGTEVPIEIAPAAQVAVPPELTQEFLHSVLGVEWALITDETELWHFALGGSVEDLYAKIDELYAVDVRDVPGGNIAQILERISAARRQSRSRTP